MTNQPTRSPESGSENLKIGSLKVQAREAPLSILNINIPRRHVILGTGATGKLLSANRSMYNMPERATATSSHIRELNIPGIPLEARTGYIIPALTRASLI